VTIKELHDIKNNSRLLIHHDEIQIAIQKLADQIEKDYKNKNPIFIVVLNGALIFSGHFLSKIKILCQTDYCHATRYMGRIFGKKVEWKAKPQIDLKDRHIIIVDDILDEGHTLSAITQFCHERKAKSVKSLVLVEKEHHRKNIKNYKADYCELTVPDEYVFGFGMDYNNYWRNLESIYSIKPS